MMMIFTSGANPKLNEWKLRTLSKAAAESADATDLKSVDGDIVRVRPPPAPQVLRFSRLMEHATLQVLSRYLRQTKGDLGDSYKSIFDGE